MVLGRANRVKIHPTALVDGKAELGAGVEIGPYAVIEGEVRIGEDCEIGSHVILQGPLSLGRGNRVFPHAVLGLAPQDLKYRDERTSVEVGDGNTFREFSSVHRGTAGGRGRTVIGSGNLVMASSHVAHDALIGDRCVLSNGVMLAGHVEIGDGGIVGGLTGIHQFVRVGRGSFVGGCSAIDRDAVPFGLAAGNRARLRHYNAVGLSRQGASIDSVARIRSIFRVLLDSSLSTAQALERLQQEQEGPELTEILGFIQASKRGILRGRRARSKEA
jgi:UDP-N-acetylglucosamine acyltransferase